MLASGTQRVLFAIGGVPAAGGASPACRGPLMPFIERTARGRNEPRAGATSAASSAYVDIRLDGGAPRRQRLNESTIVIGRVPGVQLLLDHHTVSRRHAEMFCDPFGRWWIRDHGSTNGTMVGAEPVPAHSERLIAPGDRVAIGDFTLTFGIDRDSGAPEADDAPSFEDDKPTAIRKLADLELPRIAAGHLRTLLEFSRRLLEVEDPVDRVDALCELIIGNEFCGTLAVVMRIKSTRTTMLSRPHRPGRQLAEGRPYISRRVLDMLRETHEAVLATNMTNRFPDNAVIEISMAREVMELWVIACPFRIEGDVMDVLYAHIPRDCGSAEWLNLYALAGEVYSQGEAAWAARKHAQAHAAIERELETARQIQRGLVPTQLLHPGLEVAVGFDPCKWVGGDYVDVIPLSDGRVLLAVADVCGKGLQAALVGSSLHTMVRATSDNSPPLTQLVERVNRHLCEWLPSHSFVTLVAAVIDPATGELECINAGHPPVFIADRRGGLRLLQEAENPALGIAVTTMVSRRSRLEPGDVLAMYTDGLTELRNAQQEMLGQDRLGQELARICAGRPPPHVAAIAEGLTAALDAFRAGELPEDDRTFLLAERV